VLEFVDVGEASLASSLEFPLAGALLSSSGIASAEEYCLILQEIRMLDTMPIAGNR
jgi:hypothetical protein